MRHLLTTTPPLWIYWDLFEMMVSGSASVKDHSVCGEKQLLHLHQILQMYLDLTQVHKSMFNAVVHRTGHRYRVSRTMIANHTKKRLLVYDTADAGD